MTVNDTPLDALKAFARVLADPNWTLSVPEPAKDVIRDLLAALESAEDIAKWLIAEEAYKSDSYSLKKEAQALRKVTDELGEILQEDPPLIPDLLNRWVAKHHAHITQTAGA